MLKGANGREVVEPRDGAPRRDSTAAAEGRHASARSTTRARSSSARRTRCFGTSSRARCSSSPSCSCSFATFARRCSRRPSSRCRCSSRSSPCAVWRLGQPDESRRARLRPDRRCVGRDGRELRAPAARRARIDADATCATLIRDAAFEVGRPDRVRRRDHRRRVHPDLHARGNRRAACSGRWRSPSARRCSARSLLALTYVPAVASYVLRRDARWRADRRCARGARWFVALRARIRAACSRGRSRIAGDRGRRRAGAARRCRSASVPFLGTEFMPKLDEGYMLIESRRIPSTSLAQGMAVSERRRAHAQALSRGGECRDEPRPAAGSDRDDGAQPGATST